MAKETPIKTLVNQRDKVITLKSVRYLDYLPLEHIVYIKAENNYCNFVTIDKKNYLITNPLKHYEQLLEAYGFIRINRSFIVNRQHLKQYHLDRKLVSFTNGITIKISNRTNTKLLEL